VVAPHSLPGASPVTAYKHVRHALSTFCIQDGFSREFADEIVEESLRNVRNRRRLQQEMIELLADPEVSWTELLVNDEYEVEEPNDEADAREIVLELLWPSVFPDRPLPTTTEPPEDAGER